MHCDHCGKLLVYWREIIEVSPTSDGLRAARVEESTRDNREQPAPTGKYHPECYTAANESEEMLPEVG